MADGYLLLSTEDRNVLRHPLVIRHTLALFALRGWCAPELNSLEVFYAVGRAAFGTQEFVAFAGGGNSRNGAEPSS